MHSSPHTNSSPFQSHAPPAPVQRQFGVPSLRGMERAPLPSPLLGSQSGLARVLFPMHDQIVYNMAQERKELHRQQLPPPPVIENPTLSPEDLGITRSLPVPHKLAVQFKTQHPSIGQGRGNANGNSRIQTVAGVTSMSPQLDSHSLYMSPMMNPSDLFKYPQSANTTPLIVGKYTQEERVAKISKYKAKIQKWRNAHPVSRHFSGRSKVAEAKPRYKGRFVTSEFLEQLKGEDEAKKGFPSTLSSSDSISPPKSGFLKKESTSVMDDSSSISIMEGRREMGDIAESVAEHEDNGMNE